MKTIHLLTALILTLTATAGSPARAAEQAMPIAGHTVLFGCHVRDGKTVEDVWSVLEEFARVVPPRDDRTAFLWMPLVENDGLHLRWGVTYESLSSYAEARTQFESSAAWAPWASRYGETLACTSSLLTSRDIRVGVLSNTADRQRDAIVEHFQCSLNEGMKQADLDEVVARWQAEMEKIPSEAARTYSGWLWQAYIAAPYDYAWTGAYPDLQTWAIGETDFFAHAPTAEAYERFGEVGRCDSSLWFGYWIIAPQ